MRKKEKLIRELTNKEKNAESTNKKDTNLEQKYSLM